jgi:putative endonuclease
MKTYYVYILASRTRVLYTGVSGNLEKRLWYHRNNPTSFASRYACNRLVYYETCPAARDAIVREKQIKGWSRAKKLALIAAFNPGWLDFSKEFGIGPNGVNTE